MNFEFFIDGVLVGTSELEKGDPPMGVAHGEFFPSPNFETFRHRAKPMASDYRRWSIDKCTLPSGEEINADGGIVVFEYDFPEGSIFEVTCLGISKYAELFPQHVKAYEESFLE